MADKQGGVQAGLAGGGSPTGDIRQANRAEYCVFGEQYGEYVFRCATSPANAAADEKRPNDGATRVVRISRDASFHTHNSAGECIPKRYLYRSFDARHIGRTAVNRAILWGEVVHHI